MIAATLMLVGSINVHAQQDKAFSAKLSSDVRRVMVRQSLAPLKKTKEEKICAFVRFKEGDAELLLAKYGCEKVTQIGDIYIANIPVTQIEPMAADDAVERIETKTGGKMQNDLTPQWVNSTDIYKGTGLPQAYDGTGVLLGIVDLGFDMSHPSLYALDGKTYRVKGFVDDFADKNETRGVPTPLGREYLSEADILGNLHVGDTLTYHGTHTLGTAAGSGYGTPYRGVAYGADIFAISSVNSGEQSANSADQTARMKRIFDYADQTGQPCVITYSIGFDDNPNESQLFSEALQSMLGPGRILVASAGNDGFSYTYLHKTAGVEAAGAGLSVKEKSSSPSFCYLASEQPFHLKCLSCNLEIDYVNATAKYVFTDSVTFDTEALPTDSVVLRGHHVFVERVTGNDQSPVFYRLSDRWESQGQGNLPLFAFCIEGKDADVQAYMGNTVFMRISAFTEDTRFTSVESSHSICLPGTLPEVITVGALNTRTTFVNAAGDSLAPWGTQIPIGTIAGFSSTGPTIRGLTKPDVVAPGVNVISAGNSYCKECYGETMVTQTTFGPASDERKYPWIALSGTSMAGPCAAGIVALWLQADPTLTPDRVRDIISKTSQHPIDTLDYPNNTYGYGLIDAYAGMLNVLNIPSAIPGISTHQPAALRIEPADGNVVRLTFDTPPAQPFVVNVYSVSGMLLSNQHIQPDGSTRYDVVLPHRPRGICVVQVNSTGTDPQAARTTGSELIRF